MSLTPDINETENPLSELDAMELAMLTISTSDINMLEAQAEARARKRPRTDSESLSRPTSPDPTFQPGPAPATEPNQPRQPALNATQVAKTIIAAKKRKSEHATELLAFAELQDIERSLTMYDMFLEIRHLLRHQFAENDNWTMSKNMKEDIRSYTQAVILAPATPCYMIDGSSIQSLLKSKAIYPAAWSIFPSRLTSIRQYTGTCATDSRADLKGSIKNSITSGACLSALCATIVTNTDLKVTAAMRSRIAWLRFIYANHEAQRASKFWDFVDEQLRELRKKMNNDARRMAAFMAIVVEKDEARYKVGNDNVYTLAEEADLPQFQVAAHTAAKAIVPSK